MDHPQKSVDIPVGSAPDESSDIDQDFPAACVLKGSPAFSVYSATKAARRSFARNWAVDLKGKGIRVNAVSPGVIPTPGYHTSLGMTQKQLDEYIQSVTPAIPLGRTGTTDEIAKADPLSRLR